MIRERRMWKKERLRKKEGKLKRGEEKKKKNIFLYM
jgi:hypothetical protein